MTRHYPRPMTHHGEKVYRPWWVGFGGHAPRNAPRGFFVALFACPARAFLPAWARFRCLFACLRACLRAFLYARALFACLFACLPACFLRCPGAFYVACRRAFLCHYALFCTFSALRRATLWTFALHFLKNFCNFANLAKTA